MGRPGALLGASWAVLERCRSLLEASWGVLVAAAWGHPRGCSDSVAMGNVWQRLGPEARELVMHLAGGERTEFMR